MALVRWLKKRMFGCACEPTEPVDPEQTRQTVAQAYTHAVERATPCCGAPVPKGGVAKLAGYAADDLDRSPADAVVNSFGCGNPIAFAGVRDGHVVLDLGSGAGLDLVLAAEKVGPSGRVIGVDMTDAMIERARANAKRSGHDNIEVRKGLVENLPVTTGSVDVVASNCVLNLSTDKPAAFREIARVLKPGGTISISDIVVSDLPGWVREITGSYAACLGGAISEAEYVAGLEAAGLVDVTVRDRLVYDADQLAGLVASELPGVTPELVERALPIVAGKVQSIRVHARKPS